MRRLAVLLLFVSLGFVAGMVLTGAMRSAFASPAPVAARWRAMHMLAYPAWCAALIHGLYAGRTAASSAAASSSLCALTRSSTNPVTRPPPRPAPSGRSGRISRAGRPWILPGCFQRTPVGGNRLPDDLDPIVTVIRRAMTGMCGSGSAG